MARREMKVTRKRSLGRRKKKARTIRTIIQEMTKKKAVTRSRNMMKLTPTKNIMKLLRKARKESMVTRSSTRRDQRLLVITRRLTRMNTIKNTNSTTISMKKANIR